MFRARARHVLALLFLPLILPSVAVAEPTPADGAVAEAAANPGRPEISALQRRLRERNPGQFGGLWVDSSGGLRVATKGEAGDIRAEAAGIVSAPTAFVAVDRSEADLRAMHDKIVTEADDDLTIDGIPLAYVMTDVVNNTVVVAAVDGSEKSLARIRERFGDSVTVKAVDETVAAYACTPANCPSPLKAGLKLYRSGSFACMSGFVMWTVVPNYYLSTAGHCTNSGGGWYDTNQQWQHPAGTNRGDVQYGGWYNGSYGDIALIAIPASQKGNMLCYGTSTCGLRSITSVEVADSDYVGEWVCGQTQQGVTCDNILSTDVTAGVCLPNGGACRTIHDLRRVDFTTQPGDSGGPVYYLNEAIGIIASGAEGDTFYSHVDIFRFQAGVLVRTSP